MPKGRPKNLLSADLLPNIELAIKSFGRKAPALRKLLAMRCAIMTTWDNAEREHMVSRTELMNASRAFRRHGLAGLVPKKRPGRKPFLSPEQESTLRKWVAERQDGKGKARDWTLKELAAEVYREFGAHYAPSGMLKLLGRLKLTWKTGRPCNAKADPAAQQDFQKNSGNKSKKFEKGRKSLHSKMRGVLD